MIGRPKTTTGKEDKYKILVRFEPWMVDAMKNIAKNETRSLNGFVVNAVKSYLNDGLASSTNAHANPTNANINTKYGITNNGSNSKAGSYNSTSGTNTTTF